jgi:hypothetical protein
MVHVPEPHSIASLLADAAAIVLLSGPAHATAIASLEAFVGGFATQSASIAVDGSVGMLTLPSNYAATAGNSGYNGVISAQAYGFTPTGLAYLSIAPHLSVPAYTSAPGTLTMELTETGLTTAETVLITVDPEFTGIFHSNANSATYSLYLDPSNTAYGTANLVYTTTVTPNGVYPFAFSYTWMGTAKVGPQPFSMTEIVTFTSPPSNGGTALGPTLDASVDLSVIPAPSSFAWLAPAAALLAWVRTRRHARA